MSKKTVRANAHLTATCLCLMIWAPPTVRAQVQEIGDGGGVTVHDRPEVTLSSGATPIQTPVRRSYALPARVNHEAFAEAATAAQLSPDLVEAVAWRESRFTPGALSAKGAIGEMQLMPQTAKSLGVDPFDTRQNLHGGAAYLRVLMKRYDGDVLRTLAAYNAGPGAVDRYGGVPPYRETQAYVAAILDRLSRHADVPPER